VNTEFTKRLRILASVLSVLALIAILAVGWIYHRIRSSLPQLEGTAPVAGLSAKVTVARDALGVVTIHGENRQDVARALGFVHAQDRFFQMDVWRRAAAGELAAVFGVKALAHDRAMRLHGFRQIALQTVQQLPPEHRAILEAYCAGVNAGLQSLREKPFEYVVARVAPEPWKLEDTFLVSDAMLVDLQDDTGRYEQTLMTLRDRLGMPALAFFAPLVSPTDAALDGTTQPIGDIPAPKVINLRAKTASAARPLRQGSRAEFAGISGSGQDAWSFLERQPELTPGSNAFALAGAHTATGAALLASDIHLNLRVPNVWYRASLEYPGHTLTGITLPGVPVIVAGSNGRVAWSFTNSYADTGDLIAIDVNPVAPSLYRAPDRTELLHFEHRRDEILVHKARPEPVDYEWTIWGPIVGRDEKGRPLAYLWTGHDPSATNLNLLKMEDVADVRSAIDVAHELGLPPQNIVIADAAGDVAWTIAGKLPRRQGYDGRLPVTFQFGDRSWNGFVPPGELPTVTTRPASGRGEILSESGRIWSANQRMLGGAALKVLGDGGYARPDRAAQIRDDIATLERAQPRDLLAVQLDDRALFLAPWNQLLLDTLTPAVTGEKAVRGALRGYAEHWEGRASTEAVAYPIARLFRISVLTRIYTPIFKACTDVNPQFNWSQLHLEAATWKLLKERPLHLLDPQYASWDELLVASADDVITELDRTGIRLPQGNWGTRNRAEIRHPFSYSMPWFLRSKLDMPPDRLPGDIDMPRVQSPTHGASERFVVSPGHEAEGIFHMPGGQSGHPLSPYYRAGHEAWVKGEPTPFLPGRTEHTLTLEPQIAHK
jgi:penicillin amidase